MKDMICKVSKNDTQRNVIDTLWPVFGIPLIRPPDSMIMLEVEAQQIACISAPGFETEKSSPSFKKSLVCSPSRGQ